MFAPEGLTTAQAFFLIWAFLLVALPLWRKALRQPALLISLPMLGASLGFLALSGPVSALTESLFKSRAGDTVALSGPLPARSIYIPDRRSLETPLYDCFANWPRFSCALPILEWFETDLVDFVEYGTDPVMRLTRVVHSPDCATSDIPTLQDTVLSSGLGICLLANPVDGAEAALQLEAIPSRMPFPNGTPYWRLVLTDREAGTVLARRDHWVVPYDQRDDDPTLPDPTGSPRQPDDTLADLIRITFDGGRYDPAADDALMAAHGLDFPVLLNAVRTGAQARRAGAIYLACRNGVVAFLSAEQREQLRAAATDIFPSGFAYPRDCAPHLR